MHNYAAAVEDCSDAIDSNPTMRRRTKVVERVYVDMGDTGKAVRDFSEAIRLGLKGPTIYLSRAEAYIGSRDFAKAAADLSEAISADPGCVRAYCYRAVCLLNCGKYAEAVDDCNEAIRATRVGATSTARAAWHAMPWETWKRPSPT